MQNKVSLYIIGILFLVFLFSCKNIEVKAPEKSINSTPEIEYDISWLEGSWIDSTKFEYKNLHYHEIWKIIDTNNLGAIKFTSKNKIPSENTAITLIKNKKKYYYSYQYNDEQITYYSDSLSKNYIRLICSVDKFPQTIEYNRIKDTLFISLSGMAGGVFRNPIYKTLKY